MSTQRYRKLTPEFKTSTSRWIFLQCDDALWKNSGMKRLLRWFGIGLGALASLAVLAYAILYGISELRLRHIYDVPMSVFSAPNDPVSISDGRRLAIVYGCYSGCHGAEAYGAIMFDQPMMARSRFARYF